MKRAVVVVAAIFVVLAGISIWHIQNVNSHLWEIYSIALESLMDVDEGLNGDITYIAIDTTTLQGVDADEIQKVLNLFREKYPELEILAATLGDLEQQGLYVNGQLEHGVLLSVRDITKWMPFRVKVEGSKFRSGIGAVGVVSTLVRKSGEWRLRKVKMTWIA